MEIQSVRPLSRMRPDEGLLSGCDSDVHYDCNGSVCDVHHSRSHTHPTPTAYQLLYPTLDLNHPATYPTEYCFSGARQMSCKCPTHGERYVYENKCWRHGPHRAHCLRPSACFAVRARLLRRERAYANNYSFLAECSTIAQNRGSVC